MKIDDILRRPSFKKEANISDEFDMAVILESQCISIFNEYVEMHPGIVKIRQLWLKYVCECNDGHCFRTFIQKILVKHEVEKEQIKFLFDSAIYVPDEKILELFTQIQDALDDN